MASRHAHAPWRKRVLVPCWVLQLLFMLLMIALTALALGVLVSWQNDVDFYELQLGGVSAADVRRTTHIIGPVWISLCSICLILTITEIILFARHKLNPLVFVIMNVIKSGIWTVLFIIDIVAAVSSGSRTVSIIGILIEAVLLLSFWIPLIYGSVIYHRFRKNKKSYKPVSHPLSNPQETGYPSQYKQFIAEEHELEAAPGRPRRLSYNHQRDTRFEAYRTLSNGNPGQNLGSPDIGSRGIPQVHVQHVDGDTIGNSRRALT